MPEVYLLIDVDGVLIPFPDSEGNGPATHVRQSVVPAGYDAGSPVPIWLNPAHGPMLAELISELPLTPVWCTSWRGDASPLIGAKLGLQPFPHMELARQDITTSHPNGYLWKRDDVSAWLGTAQAVWIDDDSRPPTTPGPQPGLQWVSPPCSFSRIPGSGCCRRIWRRSVRGWPSSSASPPGPSRPCAINTSVA
ncbi:hypothetical protein [Microbispora rosea]